MHFLRISLAKSATAVQRHADRRKLLRDLGVLGVRLFSDPKSVLFRAFRVFRS